jgi:hypothetical protein
MYKERRIPTSKENMNNLYSLKEQQLWPGRRCEKLGSSQTQFFCMPYLAKPVGVGGSSTKEGGHIVVFSNFVKGHPHASLFQVSILYED